MVFESKKNELDWKERGKESSLLTIDLTTPPWRPWRQITSNFSHGLRHTHKPSFSRGLFIPLAESFIARRFFRSGKLSISDRNLHSQTSEFLRCIELRTLKRSLSNHRISTLSIFDTSIWSGSYLTGWFNHDGPSVFWSSDLIGSIHKCGNKQPSCRLTNLHARNKKLMTSLPRDGRWTAFLLNVLFAGISANFVFSSLMTQCRIILSYTPLENR